MEIHEAVAKAHETLGAPQAPEPAETAPVTTTEAPKEGATDTTPAPETASQPASSSGRVRDPETGRFTSGTPEPKVEGKSAATPEGVSNGAAPGKAPVAGEAKADGAEPLPAPSAEVVPVRPPQSWKPAEREAFLKAPKEVQEAVQRREREITTRLNEVSEPVKGWQAFQQVVQPYESMIRDAGAQHPLQVVQNLLQTARVLRYGSPGEKAQMAARIVRDFGVGIEELDSALAGVAPQQAQAVDPTTIAAQVEQTLQRRFQAQAHEMASQRRAQAEAAFAEAHEFYGDVRDEVNAILAARGQTDPTETQRKAAYDLAVRVNPEVAGYIRQREAAKSAVSAQASTQRTMAAASSVKSTPAATPKVAAQPKTIREAIAAARAARGE